MELGKNFNKANIRHVAENKEKHISFNTKINIKLTGVTNIDGKEVRKKYSAEAHRQLQIHGIMTR